MLNENINQITTKINDKIEILKSKYFFKKVYDIAHQIRYAKNQPKLKYHEIVWRSGLSVSDNSHQ